MCKELTILLVSIIALLVALVTVLVIWNLRVHHRMSDKNEAIIRGIHENISLREELQHRLAKTENNHK